MMIVGVWWIGFYAMQPLTRLNTRPGIPFSRDVGILGAVKHSLSSLRSTVGALMEYKQAFRYLILWFCFSDGGDAHNL